MQNLNQEEELKRWHMRFSQMTGIFVYCVDKHGNEITEMSGDPEEVEQIRRSVSKEQMKNLIERVAASPLEDQAIEATAVPNLRLAAVSTKRKGKAWITWLLCAVLSDGDTEMYTKQPLEGISRKITKADFSQAIDSMREISQILMEHHFTLVQAQAENKRYQNSENEMSEALHRAEALMQIVQLLESNSAIETIMLEVLGIIGNYMGITSATLLSVDKESGLTDVMAEWCSEGAVSPFTGADRAAAGILFNTERIAVLSGAGVGEESDRELLAKLGMKAMVMMPMSITGNRAGMCICFGEAARNRLWQTEDIKFLNDAAKILQNIILKRIQKNSLAGSYASLDTILENVGSAIYVLDEETGEMLFANGSMRRIFKEELEAGTVYRIIQRGILAESGSSEIYYEQHQRWYDLYYTSISWVDGRPVYLYALYDITDKKVYQKKIEQQAYTDFLTGLFNRLCCERDLGRYIEEARKREAAGALLYLDLDDFKHINDGLGHQYGDVLLKAIAHSIRRVTGIENTCYRMGGDEFVIIVPVDNFSLLDDIIESIKEIFNKPWFLKDADYYCTMSMGMVQFPLDGENVHDLIKRADIAMYEAKKGGKNRVARYSLGIDTKSGKRLDMEKNMRGAAVAGYNEFEIYFQPIIDVQRSGMPCTGAEALIRWNSLELGYVPPSEFIPLAEYLGLINPIGNYVLIEACRYCKYWNDNGYPRYKVNVNLSVVQLLQPDIVGIVEDALIQTGIHPTNLTLEVTESLAINDMDRMKDILNNIKKLGVRIALDDFGTGYSSLNHIREIPFDVIKVDQSFIKDLEKDAYSRSFIRMVVQLAEAIGVNICIEGVETKEQYRILADMKVSLVQGYYFDKPLTPDEFEQKYTANLKMDLKKTEKLDKMIV